MCVCLFINICISLCVSVCILNKLFLAADLSLRMSGFHFEGRKFGDLNFWPKAMEP